MRWYQLILAIPPVFACIIDASLTLHGQSSEYWGGETTRVFEMSPVPHKLLAISPWLFAFAVIVWIAANVFFVVSTRRLPAMVFACSVTIAHVSGAATWILWSSQYGYQICILLKIVSGTILALSINNLYGRPDTVSAYPIFPAVVYNAALCVLLCLITYMLLIPQ
jgi:hypothetical protein